MKSKPSSPSEIDVNHWIYRRIGKDIVQRSTIASARSFEERVRVGHAAAKRAGEAVIVLWRKGGAEYDRWLDVAAKQLDESITTGVHDLKKYWERNK